MLVSSLPIHWPVGSLLPGLFLPRCSSLKMSSASHSPQTKSDLWHMSLCKGASTATAIYPNSYQLRSWLMNRCCAFKKCHNPITQRFAFSCSARVAVACFKGALLRCTELPGAPCSSRRYWWGSVRNCAFP